MKKTPQFRPSTLDELYGIPRADKFVPPDFFRGELNWKHIAAAAGAILGIGLIVYAVSNYTVSTSNRKLLEELRPKLKSPTTDPETATIEDKKHNEEPAVAVKTKGKKPAAEKNLS